MEVLLAFFELRKPYKLEHLLQGSDPATPAAGRTRACKLMTHLLQKATAWSPGPLCCQLLFAASPANSASTFRPGLRVAFASGTVEMTEENCLLTVFRGQLLQP